MVDREEKRNPMNNNNPNPQQQQFQPQRPAPHQQTAQQQFSFAQQPPLTPPQQPVMQQPQPHRVEEKHMSALGITAFVLGVIALVLSWIPIINNVAFIFALAGVIFGCFALYATRKNGKKKGRGLVIAAVIISLISGGVVLYTQSVYSTAVDNASKSIDEASKKAQHESDNLERGIVNEGAKELKLQVTISNGNAEVTYGKDGGTSNETAAGQWEKTITGDGAQKDWTLSAYPSFDIDNETPADTQVTCTITVDGKQVSHQEATGDNANVYCSASDKQ